MPPMGALLRSLDHLVTASEPAPAPAIRIGWASGTGKVLRIRGGASRLAVQLPQIPIHAFLYRGQPTLVGRLGCLIDEELHLPAELSPRRGTRKRDVIKHFFGGLPKVVDRSAGQCSAN